MQVLPLPFHPLAHLETVILRKGAVTAALAPARGGMLTRLYVDQRPILYLDEATLLDPTKSVRGGNPVLFPTPGKLAGDQWAWQHRTGHLPQHGFARVLPWEVHARSETACTLALTSSAATLPNYPWPFRCEIEYELTHSGIAIRQSVANLGDDPMPFALGYHPYFWVPRAHKSGCFIPTAATSAFDNLTKRTASPPPVDLGGTEIDLHLINHVPHGAARADAVLLLWDGARVAIRTSAEFTRWVIWSKPDTDFVCVEPWTALGNALGDSGAPGAPPADPPTCLAPGARAAFAVEFALEQ
jgi:galactose mutarotase-like enzyme